MIQRGQNLPFLAKAAEDEICIHAALDQLDGDSFAEFLVGARRFVDCAHAAASDFALDEVSSDPPADHWIDLISQGVGPFHLSFGGEQMVKRAFARLVISE